MAGVITSIPPLVEQPPGNSSSNPAGLPGITYTAAIPILPQTWTGLQTFNAGSVQYAGSVSGFVSVNGGTVASGTVSFPAVTGADILLANNNTAIVKNKSIDGLQNTLTNIPAAAFGSTTGTGAVVLSNSPTITGTATFTNISASNIALGGASNGLQTNDRSAGTSWVNYASGGIYRLFNTTNNDVLTVATNGNVGLVGGLNVTGATGLSTLTATTLAVNGASIPGGAVIGAAGNITSTTGFVGPAVFGGTAANATITLQSTTNGSPSGDAANLYGSTVTIGNANNAASIINLNGASGGGVTVNIAAAGNGLNALNVFNGVGGKQVWVPGAGSGTTPGTIQFPAGNLTLATLTGTETQTNKTLTSPSLTTPTITGVMNYGGVTLNAAVTGTGSMVLSSAPTISGHPTIEGVTSTGATGTGNFVFSNSPALVTPALGTPSALVLTNATGLPLSGHTTQAAFTFVGNNTGSAAAPTAVDIAALTAKASPVATDLVMISDQAASGAWKKVTVSSLASAGSVASIGGLTGTVGLTGPLSTSANNVILGGTTTAHGLAIWEGTSPMGNTGTGTTGQALISGGASADPSWKSGAPVLLNTLTASASATLSDTTSLTSAYNEYEIVFENVVPATNSVTLELQVHSGGSFLATNYFGTTLFVGAATNVVNTTTFIQLSATALVPNTGAGISGHLKIFTPSGTAAPKQMVGISSCFNGGANNTTTFGGQWNGGNGAVDGFQVLFSSGNITSGVVKIYGIL